MTDPTRQSLNERLAKLPRDITPPRNLWPGIARSIERSGVRSPRRSRPMALAAAAAVAAACVASALTWAVLQGRPNQPPVQLAAQAPRYAGLTTARYVAARDSQEHIFQQ